MSTNGKTAEDVAAGDDADMAILARLDNRIDELEDRVETQQATIEHQQEAIDRLERENEELRARTDLLSLVEDSEEMDGFQRSVTLLQHLQNKAQQEAGRGRSESAAVDHDKALEALHHPGVDRTTVYSDFQRAERLVGDTDVCRYDGGRPARLILNLENGDLPTDVATKEVSA